MSKNGDKFGYLSNYESRPKLCYPTWVCRSGLGSDIVEIDLNLIGRFQGRTKAKLEIFRGRTLSTCANSKVAI